MIEAGRRARERLLEEDFQTEDEKERSALSPLHRLHFADVVEAVMGGSASESHHGQKEQHASAAASVDKEKAARKAGALWAEKMLGDRRFNARSGEGQEDASGTRTPPESPTRGRHFAEMVEAVMKKEGIKPGGWAEGALDVFGMGQSSSKNVAEQVRKSRTARPSRDAQARGLSIPQAVNEESAVQSSAPQTPAFSPVGDDAADAKSGDALRADQVQLNVTAPTSEDAGQAKANGSIPVAEAKADTESAPLALEVHPVDPEAEHQSKARPELAPIKTSASASSGLTVPGAEHSRLKGSAKQGISVDDDAVSASSSDNGSPKGQAAELNAGGENKDGAPGSVAYRRLHQRTMSNLSRTSAAEKLGQITKSLDFANNSKVKGEITPEQLAKVAQGVAAAANDGDLLDFQPYVFHKPHKPVPMALVNRRPHGTPGHSGESAQRLVYLSSPISLMPLLHFRRHP